MSIGLAFKAFFAILFNKEAAQRIREALDGKLSGAESRQLGKSESEKPKPSKTEGTPSGRSEALILLSTLQREARWLDLVQEPLDGFDDAQIGAAAREVLRDCRKTLDRMFAIEPLSEFEEGSAADVHSDASPNRQRLVGKSEGVSGTVVHRGWKATRCDLPKWSGSKSDIMLLAPTEIEIQ